MVVMNASSGAYTLKIPPYELPFSCSAISPIIRDPIQLSYSSYVWAYDLDFIQKHFL